MPFNPNDAFQRHIVKSFIGPRNDYRTIGGISRETGLPISQVNDFISSNPDVFRAAPFQPGRGGLYSLNPNFSNPLDSTTEW